MNAFSCTVHLYGTMHPCSCCSIPWWDGLRNFIYNQWEASGPVSWLNINTSDQIQSNWLPPIISRSKSSAIKREVEPAESVAQATDSVLAAQTCFNKINLNAWSPGKFRPKSSFEQWCSYLHIIEICSSGQGLRIVPKTELRFSPCSKPHKHVTLLTFPFVDVKYHVVENVCSIETVRLLLFQSLVSCLWKHPGLSLSPAAWGRSLVS